MSAELWVKNGAFRSSIKSLKNGLKIGLMGLIEYDWIAIMKSNLAPEDYKFIDYNEKASELIRFFKSEKCDIIIALTHMRNYNDMYIIVKIVI